MYGEPDWSEVPVSELLDKARAFAEKAYSNALSTEAFLMRVLEASSKRSTLTTEIAELSARTQHVYQELAEIHRALAKIAPKPSPSNGDDDAQ